jgi:hypothetical protein
MQYLRAGESAAGPTKGAGLTRNIPPRPSHALTGSQFAELASNMDRQQREQAILDQLLQGNLPGFLRQLVPVTLGHEVAGKSLSATVFVMPEYLAIGSDDDYLRIPMNLHTAKAVANRFRFLLPTKKMVDAIYNQSTGQFIPQPLPAGPQMTSTKYYRTHNTMIDTQSENRDFPADVLVAGHKKDVVLTNRLIRNPGRIAIYGWHRAPGAPIQPLSTVHGAGYADYSHGIRLVAEMAVIEGRLRPVRDILKDSTLAATLSDEGAIHVASALAHA